MLGEAEAGVSGGCFQHLIAPLLTLLAQGPAHQALVIHNKDLLCPRHAALAYYGCGAGDKETEVKRRAWMGCRRFVSLPAQEHTRDIRIDSAAG